MGPTLVPYVHITTIWLLKTTKIICAFNVELSNSGLQTQVGLTLVGLKLATLGHELATFFTGLDRTIAFSIFKILTGLEEMALVEPECLRLVIRQIKRLFYHVS